MTAPFLTPEERDAFDARMVVGTYTRRDVERLLEANEVMGGEIKALRARVDELEQEAEDRALDARAEVERLS